MRLWRKRFRCSWGILATLAALASFNLVPLLFDSDSSSARPCEDTKQPSFPSYLDHGNDIVNHKLPVTQPQDLGYIQGQLLRAGTGNDDADLCAGYDGVLRIRSGDVGAAAATVFFLYVINHSIYADMCK